MGQSSDETVFSKVGQSDQTTKQYAQRLLPLFEMIGIDVVRACVGVPVSGGGGGCGGFDGLTKREAILWLALNIFSYAHCLIGSKFISHLIFNVVAKFLQNGSSVHDDEFSSSSFSSNCFSSSSSSLSFPLNHLKKILYALRMMDLYLYPLALNTFDVNVDENIQSHMIQRCRYKIVYLCQRLGEEEKKQEKKRKPDIVYEVEKEKNLLHISWKNISSFRWTISWVPVVSFSSVSSSSSITPCPTVIGEEATKMAVERGTGLMRTVTGGVRTLATKAPTTEERMVMEIEREEEGEEVVMRMAGGGGGGGGGRGRGGGALTLTEEEEEGEEGTTPTQKQVPSPPLLLKTVGGVGGEVKIYQSTLSAIVKKLKDILLQFLQSLKLNSLYQNHVWMLNGPVIAAAAAPSSSTSNPLKPITWKSIVLDDDPSNSNSGGGGHGGGHGGSGSGFGGFIKEDD